MSLNQETDAEKAERWCNTAIERLQRIYELEDDIKDLKNRLVSVQIEADLASNRGIGYVSVSALHWLLRSDS